MTSCSICRFYFVFLFLIICQLGHSQIKTKAKSDQAYNIYRNEIGLDVQNLNRDFRLNNIASNLIYKRLQPIPEDAKPNVRKAMRYQFFASGRIRLNNIEGEQRLNGPRLSTFNDERTALIGFQIGKEKQHIFKRLLLYYGLDVGLSYSQTSDPSNGVLGFTNGNLTRYGTSENQNLSIPFDVFIGIKYFLHPRISISLESAQGIAFSLSKQTDTMYDSVNDPSGTSKSIDLYDLVLNSDFLRFLNVSLHF